MAREAPRGRREMYRRSSKREQSSRKVWLVKLVAVAIIVLFILSSLIALFVH